MKKILLAALALTFVTAQVALPSASNVNAKLSSVRVTYFKPPQVGVASTYKIEIDINQTVEIHGWITIIFPDDWTMPDTAKPGSGLSDAESNELERILNSIYLATSPCTKCQGLPVIKTNKRTNPDYKRKYGLDSENSITFWSHIKLEPNGPYDPIPITVAARAGFKNSNTPGKYRLGIRTHSEQDTVYSNEITVVKSSVEPATVTLTNPAIGEQSGYNIRFHVGEGGSLDRSTSRISMVFPKGTTLPEKIETNLMKINGRPLAVEPSIHIPSSSFSFITPIDIENLGEINIDISEKAGIRNTTVKGDHIIQIRTDFEPDPIDSKPFAIIRAGQKPQVIPPYAGQIAAYKFSVDFPKSLNENDMIEITFPKETSIPTYIKQDTVIINDIPCKQKPGVVAEERKVRIYSPTVIKPGSIMIEFTKDAKIKNPETPGEYVIKFSGQVVDGTFPTDPYSILIKKMSIDSVKVTPMNASQVAEWELVGSLAYVGPLEIGDNMVLTFPEGTVIPASLDGCVTIGGVPTTATGSGNTLTLTMPQKIDNGGEFKILITRECGIKNPPDSSDKHIIKISSSKDPTGGESEAFFIAPPLPVSTLKILKSNGTDANGNTIWIEAKPDGKDGWFKIPPAIDFSVNSPTATIRMWWNNETEKSIDWEIGKPLAIADQQRLDMLHWQALDAYGDEEVRSFEFKVDTNSPTLSLKEPGSKKVIIRQNKLTIIGLADPSELLKYGDKDTSPYVVPDVYINDEKVDVVQPVVKEMKPEGAILNEDAGIFKKEITLDKEGTYTYKIIAEDQAGWKSTTLEFEVTYDKTPPEVKMIYPVYGDYFDVGKEIEVKFESEISATLFANNSIANLVEQLDERRAIFSSFVKIAKKGENTIEIKASDEAGNEQTYTFTIYGSPTVINLWLGQKTMMTNGVRSVLATAPISGDPLPKDLQGNTFMPIKDVATVLFCEVGWIAETKTIPIKQSLPGGKTKTVELQIKNKKAKIDGKEVPLDPKGKLYPVIVGSKTLLPLKFVADSLGAKVDYDQVQRMITITYPDPTKK